MPNGVPTKRAGSNHTLSSALIAAGLLALGFARKRRPARGKRDARRVKPPAMVSAPLPRKTRLAWREMVRLLYSAIGQHRVVSIAAGVTFFSLLAIFPAIAALVSIYGLFADPTTIQTHLNDLSSLLPGGAIEVVGDQLKRVASGGRTTLGATFIFSLAVSLWSANAGIKALFDALNIVYGATECRGLIKLNAVSLTFTAAGLLATIVALGAVVILPAALNYIGGSSADWLLRLGRWPALYCIIIVGLAAVYRFGPDRKHARWQWITWGSATAALLWIVVSALFSWYAANFGSYNKTYGSLGAVVGFMTWIWITCMIVLAGAEIDALMERLDRGSAK